LCCWLWCHMYSTKDKPQENVVFLTQKAAAHECVVFHPLQCTICGIYCGIHYIRWIGNLTSHNDLTHVLWAAAFHVRKNTFSCSDNHNPILTKECKSIRSHWLQPTESACMILNVYYMLMI
jgi:hypothetical protein